MDQGDESKMSDIDGGARYDEWSSRKDEIATAFEGATTNPVVDRVVGVWLMASGAAVVSLALLGRERGQRRPWMAPFGSLLVLAGLTVLGGSASDRRDEHIAEAEAEIRE